MSGAEDFIGTGLAFPLRVNSTGNVALVSREREIEESIALILGTAPGERPLRPEFGCAIHDYVFAPADVATAGEMADAVRRALLRWEPRIEVGDVIVSPDPHNHSLLYVDVGYRIRYTNDPRNLVFPFYVIPDHGSDESAAPRSEVDPAAWEV
jgi:Bacteriophage baseplate protein W